MGIWMSRQDSSDHTEAYPEPRPADRAASIIKIALAGVPLVGGPATELLGLLAGTVADRRDNWLRNEIAKVWEEIHTLRSDLEPEQLAKDPQFVTAVVRATQVAVGTHKQEKLQMLRIALRRIGLGSAPGDDLQEIYFRLIDELTPSHVHVLKFLWSDIGNLPNPLLSAGRPAYGSEPPQPVPRDVVGAILGAIPGLESAPDFIEQILFDLNARRLLRIRENVPLPQGQLVTNHGIGFLNFVLG